MERHFHCVSCGVNCETKGLCVDCYCEGKTLTVTALMVRTLREMSGWGLMDCKRALDSTYGNIEAANALLSTKGLA